ATQYIWYDAHMDETVPPFRHRTLPTRFQREPAGDEMSIQANVASGPHDPDEVAPGERRSSGQMQLGDTEVSGLDEDVEPLEERHLFTCGDEIDGVGAVGTVQGAAVRDLGDDPEGTWPSHSSANWRR